MLPFSTICMMLKLHTRCLQISITYTPSRNSMLGMVYGFSNTTSLQHNIKTTRPCGKLGYQCFGSYMISDVAFPLGIPLHMRPYPVFHVSLLEPYTITLILGPLTTPPPLIEFLEGPKFEVASILDSKIVQNELYDLVRICPQRLDLGTCNKSFQCHGHGHHISSSISS